MPASNDVHTGMATSSASLNHWCALATIGTLLGTYLRYLPTDIASQAGLLNPGLPCHCTSCAYLLHLFLPIFHLLFCASSFPLPGLYISAIFFP